MTNQIVLIVTCNFHHVSLIFTLQPPGWVNDVREEILRRSVCFYPNVVAYVVLNCGPNSIKHFEHLRCAQAKILHIAVDTQSEVRNVDLFVPNKLWFVKAPNIYCQTSCRRALSTSRPWAQKRLGKCLGSTPHPIEKIVIVLFNILTFWSNHSTYIIRCLHGQWYRGQLVTAKYLRLER